VVYRNVQINLLSYIQRNYRETIADIKKKLKETPLKACKLKGSVKHFTMQKYYLHPQGNLKIKFHKHCRDDNKLMTTWKINELKENFYCQYNLFYKLENSPKEIRALIG